MEKTNRINKMATALQELAYGFSEEESAKVMFDNLNALIAESEKAMKEEQSPSIKHTIGELIASVCLFSSATGILLKASKTYMATEAESVFSVLNSDRLSGIRWN